ncbi:hypothetical protein N7520_011157 [Penicillium odoratum]|uniref:uncharacterized protein n=1 Tax=Penicillium odoratum TaxID=1167516 RepID=UPI0025483270|nr:uncharacterized protein N7520_011157 [Penicillium odoratum]KAJ5745975.1 hypothetical protein N7520_011157 [Penicillium odoratum]
MSRLRVLIVGASIAGPTAAYWFTKAGAKVTVIERFPELRTDGHNVDIRVAGVTIMRKMPDQLAILTSNPLISEYEIFRGDLSRILYDMTKENKDVKYVFGEQVASIQQDPSEDGPVTVEFTGSMPTAQFDLVVACDGATSRTRSIGLAVVPATMLSPQIAGEPISVLIKISVMVARIGHAHSAVGGRFMAVGVNPAGGTRIIFMGCNSRSDLESILPFRKAMKEGDDAVKNYISQHYQGVGWKANEAVRSILASGDFYAIEFVQVKTSTLSKGHFVLVGDAGYAPGLTGTGTTLAIAGAYLLAGEVCKHEGDIDAALRGYETQMRPLINDLQKISPLIHSFVQYAVQYAVYFLLNRLLEHTCIQ